MTPTETVIEATSDGANWELVFIAFTAGGTLLLALVTFTLALSTRRMASATRNMARETERLATLTESEVKAVREQVELSRQSVDGLREQVEVARQEVDVSRATLEATIQPVLASVARPTSPEEVAGGIAERYDDVGWPGFSERRRISAADVMVFEADDEIYVSVPFRNVGPGVAFVRTVGFQYQSDYVPYDGNPTSGIVPPGEAVRVQLIVHKSQGETALTLDEMTAYGTFSAQVVYTDAGGGQLSMTVATINRDAQTGRWFLGQVFVHRGKPKDDGSIDWSEPVAASGAASPV